MTSEIRANTLKNRVGLGTIEYSNTGPVISGVTTSNNFKTGSTNVHSVGIEAAGINVLGADTPIGTGATIYNSGAAVFTGVVTATSFSGGTVKATNLTSDRVVFTTTNGQLEASGNLTYNGTTLASGSPVDINADLDVDGHTNLDNVSIAGITTITSSSKDLLYLNSTHSDGPQIPFQTGGTTFSYIGSAASLFSTGSSTDLGFRAESGKHILFGIGANEKLRITSGGSVNIGGDYAQTSRKFKVTGNSTFDGDLDVDGHTNLDNVSISGITTFAQAAGAVTVPAGGDIRIANSGGWTGEYGGKIQHYSNFLYIQGGSNGIRFRYSDGNDRWVIGSGGHFDPGAAGSYDMGNTGNRIRQIYSTHVNISGITSTTKANIGYTGTSQESGSFTKLSVVGTGSPGSNPSSIQNSTTAVFRMTGATAHASSIAILAGNTGSSALHFGDTDNDIIGRILYNHTSSNASDYMAFYVGSDERVRISDGLTALYDSTGAYHKPTLKIANQYHGRYGGSLVFTAENGSGTEYTTARIRAYGGGSDTGGQIGVGCGDFSTGDGDKLRIFADGKISISPTGNCTSYTNALAVTIIQNAPTNGYPGIHLKSTSSGGGEGMSFVATDGNWDLYTRSGNENGLGILRAGAASSGNARFVLTQGGNLTVGDHTFIDLATSKKGHTMMHVAGGGLSIGPKGNNANSTQGGRYVLGWYMTGYSSSHTYLHLITDLWAGGSPHNNVEYIMGGFHIHGHQYAGGASVGRERIYFHNWSGSYPGYSNSNPGNWSPGNTVYTHSTGYVALRLLTGSYRGYIIDLIQHAWYGVRDMNVTSATYSNSTTL